MLPYFVSCGHNNYTKSAWLYLQQMNDLGHINTQVYQDFMAGYHVVCQSDGHTWGGVLPDRITEQTSMRSLKQQEGLQEEQDLKKSNVIFTSYPEQYVLKSVHQWKNSQEQNTFLLISINCSVIPGLSVTR